MTLAELEKELDVTFPKKFHEIYDTGAMEWVEAGHEKFTENREKYFNDPKAFLMVSCDCEPYFFEDIPGLVKTLDEMLEWRKEATEEELAENCRLVPFAMNGGGDIYCFLYKDGENEPSVVLYFHDCYDLPEIIGKDFDEFLYIEMLSCIAYAEEEDDFSELESEQWQNNLSYLDEKYRKVIESADKSRLADMYWAIDFAKAEIFS